MSARKKITKSDISSSQIRAARGLLGWSQEDLATVCGIARRTIHLIESENSNSRVSTLRAIQKALEAAGVEFILSDKKGLGVRFKNPVT